MFEESIRLIKNSIGAAFPCAAVAVGIGHKVSVRSSFYDSIIKEFNNKKNLAVTYETKGFMWS